MTKSHLEKKIFFDGPVEIARYEKVKYPIFDEFVEKQSSFFWRPQEVEVYKDAKDFKALSPGEQHISKSILQRAIALDSKQGQAPVLAFGPIVSLPEVEAWLATWQYFETIHSRSYTYIIRNIYSDPSKVFDEISEIESINDCSKAISKYYDELIYLNSRRGCNYPGQNIPSMEIKHKKALYRALIAVYALEGIRFYAAFATMWAFAETKRMEGTAKIIKSIARDENLHLGFIKHLLKILPKDDPEFIKIKEEEKETAISIIREVVDQEVAFGKYLFQYGSMIGLNETLFNAYIYWRTNKCLVDIGLPIQYDVGKNNPLPWTERWINSGSSQDANQETINVNYVTGNIKQDLTPDFLSTLKL